MAQAGNDPTVARLGNARFPVSRAKMAAISDADRAKFSNIGTKRTALAALGYSTAQLNEMGDNDMTYALAKKLAIV